MDMRGAVSSASFLFPNYITTSAWIEHGPFAFWLVETLRPNSIVELGTHWGFSYFAFCQAVALNKIAAKCFAVDTWRGDEHAGFYGENVYKEVDEYNKKYYSSFSELLRMPFQEAAHYFEDGSIDLLHIDGRHYYEDVKLDFESWKSKLSNRSIVIFHDTNVRERDFGVFKLWSELSKEFPHFEFLHGHGLGVLGYGSNIPDEVMKLFEQDDLAISATRLAYARLGEAVATHQQLAELRQLVGRLHGEAAQEAELKRDLAQKNEMLSRLATDRLFLSRFIGSEAATKIYAFSRHPTNSAKRKKFRDTLRYAIEHR